MRIVCRLYFLVCFGQCLSYSSISQTNTLTPRPKIGLTLSGGGAKGLAHIGILKAIDSAGLKIDYITGTSMGAIVGALYAAGYSADSIETIARNIDWDLFLSNQLSLRNIIMEEKSEYGKYDLELPWVNNWFRLNTGVLEGQELWLKFSELLFPVHGIKDFSKLPIPFKCIATDISSGEAVVIDSGELVSAIRASMAIPSIFTAVEYDGKKLVDGGVVRNFPVKDVRDMGAQFVIGSNVANGLLASNKVVNALQVLLQVAFFREAIDTREEVPLCNIYVQTPLEKYSMGSFTQADDIIKAGLEEGRRLYPRLKQLADSLNALYGTDEKIRVLPSAASVKISSAEVAGVYHTTRDFFFHTMGLLTNRTYTPDNLSRMVRRAAGTRYYNRIVYSLEPQADSSCKILFDVTENPLTFAKIGLQYSQFSGISAILNLTARDFFIPNSRSLVSVNIGENFRVRGEHLQYIGRSRNFAFTLSTQFDQFNITSYSKSKEDGLYGRGYFVADGKLGYSTNRNLTIGVGSRFEWIRYSPSIVSAIAFKGTNNFVTGYFYLKQNTLDKPLFPRRGLKIDAEGGWVFMQHPDIKIHSNNTSDVDTAIASNPYPRISFNMENYAPLSKRTTFLMNLQSGIDFRYKSNIMNEFSIGGLTPSFHNQIIFAGLRENSYYSPSLAAMLVGLRYQLFSNVFLTGRINTLFDNFISRSDFFHNPDFLSGYSLTFSYNFALGPIEISAMYCDQWKTVIGYVNIGIPF